MRGRIRTVKPELFTDERLWDLAVSTGLPVLQAFIGLWCFADREGRFEWRPRALRAMVLPFWDGDMDAVLDALASRSFIVRYTVEANDYGFIRTFAAHQVVPHRESKSTIPDPALHGHPSMHGSSTGTTVQCPGGREGKGMDVGREGKGKDQALLPHGRSGATPVQLPEPDLTEPATHTRIPDAWKPSAEFYGEATLAGVTRDLLDEDVAYWRGRKLGGEWFTIEQFFRAHFPRLAKRRETESFKATRRGGSPQDDVLQRQADRVEMLRAQEAEEERLAAGGGT